MPCLRRPCRWERVQSVRETTAVCPGPRSAAILTFSITYIRRQPGMASPMWGRRSRTCGDRELEPRAAAGLPGPGRRRAYASGRRAVRSLAPVSRKQWGRCIRCCLGSGRGWVARGKMTLQLDGCGGIAWRLRGRIARSGNIVPRLKRSIMSLRQKRCRRDR